MTTVMDGIQSRVYATSSSSPPVISFMLPATLYRLNGIE